MSFQFNGITKNYIRILRGLERPVWAPIEQEIIEVPGRAGGIITSRKTKVRTINVPVRVYTKGFANLQEAKEDLAAWLITDEPKPLVFPDEPDRTYFAEVTGELNLDELVEWGEGVISFVCQDPYKYGPEIEATFPGDVVSLHYNGTAETEPVFEFEVTQPVTFALIQNHLNEYMMVGQPAEVTSTPFQKYEQIFFSECDSLLGWTTANPGEIDGTITGTMKTDGLRFTADSYGTGTGWHGPAIKTSLSEALSDFRLVAHVALFNGNVAKQVGRVEIYLLDENGVPVCKLAVKDMFSDRALTYAEARAGTLSDGYYMVNEYGDKPGVWNNFEGQVEISREGNKWYAYFAMVDRTTKKHHTRRSVTWFDTAGKYIRNVAQVLVHVGVYGNHSPIDCGVYLIRVYKINQQQQLQIPYIANVGDVITFDHQTNDILINGVSRMDLKDFGARFFSLKKGQNIFNVYPTGSFNVKCYYRERYL